MTLGLHSFAFLLVLMVRTSRHSEESCSRLGSAHPVLGHALVDSVILRAHIEDTQHVCREAVT